MPVLLKILSYQTLHQYLVHENTAIRFKNNVATIDLKRSVRGLKKVKGFAYLDQRSLFFIANPVTMTLQKYNYEDLYLY